MEWQGAKSSPWDIAQNRGNFDEFDLYANRI